MRLRSCGLIFAMLTGAQDALGGHFQVDVLLFAVTGMWGIVPALIMGHRLPAPTRTSFVLHSNRRGQLSPISFGKNQSKSSAREG